MLLISLPRQTLHSYVVRERDGQTRSPRKGDAFALLKRRMGEHATGHHIGADAKRLTFEDLEAGAVASYELKRHGSLLG
jgi:hypothetical protein